MSANAQLSPSFGKNRRIFPPARHRAARLRFSPEEQPWLLRLSLGNTRRYYRATRGLLYC